MALRLHLRPPGAAAALCSKLSASRSLPARDRVIDFGKHKGRMLGSLPSSYLQWVSKNLRARDFEEWARLADEVLRDPVYSDRLEWEAAERILTGDTCRRSSSGPADSPVADLIEVSERFGWDNEDKAAWARIDFGLLGTSKGGRIPRVRKKGSALAKPARKSIDLGVKSNISRSNPDLSKGKQGASSMNPEDSTLRADWKGSNAGRSAGGGRKAGPLSKGHRFTIEGRDEKERGKGVEMEAAAKTGNREEKRQSRRFKRKQQLQMVRREVGVEVVGEGRGNAVDKGEEIVNPFPGRRALLEKARRRQFVE